MENKNSIGDFITPRTDDEIDPMDTGRKSDRRFNPNSQRARFNNIVSRKNNIYEKNKSTFQTTQSLNLNSEYEYNAVDEKEFLDLKNLLAEKNETIQKLEKLIQDQKNINQENEEIIANYQVSDAKFKSNIDEDKKQLNALGIQLNDKNNEIDQLIAEKTELENKCKNLENINVKYDEVFKLYQQLKQDNIELEKQLKTKPEKDAKGADKTLDQYREHLQEANYNLKLKENECSTLKEKNTELKTEVQLLQTRLAASTNPDYFDRLTKRMQELLEAQEKTAAERDRLKTIIAEKTKKIEQLISKGQSLNIDLESSLYDDIPYTESIGTNVDSSRYNNPEYAHYINMESARVISEDKTNSQSLPQDFATFDTASGNSFKLKFDDIINNRNKGSSVISSIIRFFLIIFIIRTLIWL